MRAKAPDRKLLPARVPVADAEAIQARAEAAGVTLTAYMSALVRQHLAGPALSLTTEAPEALFDVPNNRIVS